MRNKNILFIGLGTMGYHMAGHLSINKKINAFVWNRSVNKMNKWLKNYDGNKLDNHLHNDFFDTFILCLKDDNSIYDVLVKNKFIKYLKPNSTIIDHSTTSLEIIETITKNKSFQHKNIKYIDAPVSGGEQGAIDGKLSTMIGGNNINIKYISNLISAYCKNITHIGKSGDGQLAKMVNQIAISGVLFGLSEAITFGKSSKLNMDKVFEAISAGAAQSWQLDNRFQTMNANKFNFGFAVDLMIKDLKIAIKESEKSGKNYFLTKNVLNKYKKLSKHGNGRLDTSSLIKAISK